MRKRNDTKTNSTQIQIVDADNDLENYLLSIKNKKIDIVVAFASKTEDLIQNILDNGNHLNLTIGSINYFSDPVFIKYCQGVSKNDKYKENFNFYVDFRGNDSIHWKVYLISPDIVVIGSSNLTLTGIAMTRDTVVIISDKQLYNTYQVLFTKIRKNKDVVESDNAKFGKLLSEYKKQHRELYTRNINSFSKKSKAKQLSKFSTWVKQDHIQGLSIFIWDTELTKNDLNTFKEKIKPKLSTLPNEKKKGLDVFGCCKGKANEQPYQNGDIILEMKSNGGYIGFTKADIVVYGSGNWWLCKFKSKRIAKPFALTPELERAIKQNAAKWFKQDKTFLDSKDLRNLQNT